jgi:RPA family protein
MASPASATPPTGDDERFQREVAQRLFAAEFNEARHSFKESGERSPTFVVSPYGAKVNRLFAVGVITNVESIGQTPGNYRAQVVDPTGTFYLLSGQYEPEATAKLADIRPPEIVAVVGKSRLRETPEGQVYVNVRPERLHVVPKHDRDEWIVETAKLSLLRLDAMKEALQMEPPTAKALEELGFPKEVAEGVVKAIEHYGKPQLAKQAAVIRDALESLLPGGASEETPSRPTGPRPAPAPAGAASLGSASAAQATFPRAPSAGAAPAAAAKPQAKPAAPAENPHEPVILSLCESLDDGKGAPWEDIVADAAKKGVKEEQVEECLNALMDKGLIYEPVLGRLKRT